MKLKKLDIVGFKSFLDKATIEFPPGICAVVGPNGCGKSNIVDALRWVMGEQSVKQLRGKNMEDVIFAGANGKQPTNLAEVTITLLNDNGSAPEELKDYSEITVTRRLFRSGETAYLINKQPCRLKDIHNIFMGSGMGARTYSVISQGNIGAITDAGPDERRLFIEEAAGVTRFKVRKTETLRKINSTNQNLLRVNDIISEVDRQMTGLKRQAQKAERYQAYQKRIRNIDTRLLHYHYDELSQAIEKTTALLSQVQDNDLAHTAQLKQLEAAVEAIRLRRLEKDQEISSHKSMKFELQRKTDRMEAELSHAKAEAQRLGREVEELEAAQKELSGKNQRIDSEVSQVTERNRQLDLEITALKASLEKERADSQLLREQLAGLNLQLDRHKNNLMKMVADEARLKNSHQTFAQNRENLQRRIKRIDEEEAAAGQNVRGLENRAAAAQSEWDRIKAHIGQLSQQVETIQGHLKQRHQALGQQVKLVQTLELERNQTRSKLTTLRKMAENFEWYKDGVKAIMKAWQRSRSLADASEPSRPNPAGASQPVLRAEIVGLAADVLEPEEAYQTAAEALMGESLQYVLVKDQAAGISAIEYLRSTGAGRGGFIPLDDVGRRRAPGQTPPAGSDRLLDHIAVKPGFEDVAAALLGHAVVAADVQEALQFSQGNGSHQAVVTLTGEVVLPQGVLIGGNGGNLAGILAKKQELKDLGKLAEDLEKRLEAAREDQKQLEDKVRTLEIDLQKNIEKKTQATADETEAEKALYRTSEDLKHAARHLEIVRLEQEQLMGEESDLDSELEKINRTLANVAAQSATCQQQVTLVTEEISRLSDAMEAYNQRVVDLKLKLTTCLAESENSRNTLKRLKEFQSDGLRRFEQLGGEIDQKKDKRVQAEQKILDTQIAATALYAEIQRLDHNLQTSESDYQSIDESLKDSDVQIAKIQTAREKILSQIRLLEVEVSEKRVNRENLDIRCQERYHCPVAALRLTEAPPADDIQFSPQEMEAQLERLRARIEAIGDVHLGAIEEYRLLKERFDFLSQQRDDLVMAIGDLHQVIKKINKITQERFLATFTAVNEKLKEVFPRLFEGGTAWLELAEPNNLLETGVEFMVQPAGKKLTRMSLLSGGEKALSAIAFIFAIFLLKPTSFCLMDEIDAPLDDANVFRFNHLLKVIGEKSQIVMITHNKRSMEFADTLFGITMEQKGISKVVSVNLQRN